MPEGYPLVLHETPVVKFIRIQGRRYVLWPAFDKQDIMKINIHRVLKKHNDLTFGWPPLTAGIYL